MTTGSQAPTTDRHIALLGGWRRPAEAGVPSRAFHIAAVGGSKLDLTGGEFPEGGSTFTSISFVGGADVKVPRGTRVELRWPYFVGVALAAGLFAWQQWLIRDRSRAHCFTAFRNNNWVGFALWIGLLLALAIR